MREFLDLLLVLLDEIFDQCIGLFQVLGSTTLQQLLQRLEARRRPDRARRASVVLDWLCSFLRLDRRSIWCVEATDWSSMVDWEEDLRWWSTVVSTSGRLRRSSLPSEDFVSSRRESRSLSSSPVRTCVRLNTCRDERRRSVRRRERKSLLSEKPVWSFRSENEICRSLDENVVRNCERTLREAPGFWTLRVFEAIESCERSIGSPDDDLRARRSLSNRRDSEGSDRRSCESDWSLWLKRTTVTIERRRTQHTNLQKIVSNDSLFAEKSAAFAAELIIITGVKEEICIHSFTSLKTAGRTILCLILFIYNTKVARRNYGRSSAFEMLFLSYKKNMDKFTGEQIIREKWVANRVRI